MLCHVQLKLERKKIARFIEGFSVTRVCVCDRTTVKGKKREEMFYKME